MDHCLFHVSTSPMTGVKEQQQPPLGSLEERISMYMYVNQMCPHIRLALLTVSYSPYYPEPAVNLAGNGINPRTDGPQNPMGSDPGDDCREPGPANGKFSPGASFPNYISAVWCNDKVEWRMSYSLYYA